MAACMDSPSMTYAPANIEDKGYWTAQSPAMFEVPQVNCQNYNSVNYGDWAAMPSSENRHRTGRTGRAKAHHNSSKGRNNQQYQNAWTTECGPAPASPQWQPQPSPPPPPVDLTFVAPPSFQESGEPVAVNLQGLPPALCRQNFLEAMLDQAGLADDIMGCVLGEEQDHGKAIIYVANYNAALKCVQHFGGRRWAQTGPPVTAQVAEGQGPTAANAPAPLADVARPRKTHGAKMGQEQMIMVPVPVLAGAWAMPQPLLPIMAVHQVFPETAGRDSPKPASNGSTSPKVNWADINDEDDKNDLSEGSFEANSTSAGSTNRSSKDSTGQNFFFGCDVDTDDGF